MSATATTAAAFHLFPSRHAAKFERLAGRALSADRAHALSEIATRVAAVPDVRAALALTHIGK